MTEPHSGITDIAEPHSGICGMAVGYDYDYDDVSYV